MAVSVTHATAADGTFSASGTTAWNEAHTVSGLGDLATQDAATPPALGGTTPAEGTFTTLTATTSLTVPLGSTSSPSIQPAGGGGNDGLYFLSAVNPAFVMDGTERHRFGSGGLCANTGGFGQGATTSVPDVSMIRGAANSWVFGSGSSSAGPATSRTEINKAVTAIADATATNVFTVTVPNAAHSANIEVTLTGSIGAGGAIGPNEATASIKYNVAVTRTAGANAVAVISSAYGSSGSAGVTGATTCTVTGDLGAVSGAAGATNTFTIRITVTKGGGSSTNHTAVCHAVLLNANATGVTIA